jgi:AhpD family alkylhydroperoxidase
MKKSLLVCAALAIATMTAQAADDPPKFMKQTYPDQALQGAWSDWQAVFGKDGAVPQKYKELIALGVAAQIPCQYCVYAHTLLAKKHGATDAEVKEAIAAAALVRQWSTVLNGSAYDMKDFKAELGGPTN